MKQARFIFAVIGFSALTLGVSFASESSSQPPKPDVRENHETVDRSDDPIHGSVARGKKEPADGRQLKPKEDGKRLNSKDDGKHHDSRDDGKHPSSKDDDGHHPGSKDDGKHLDSKNDRRHPGSKDDGHPHGRKDDGKHPKPADHGQASKRTGQDGRINRDPNRSPAEGPPHPEFNKTAAIAPKNGPTATKTGNQTAQPAKLPVGGGTTAPSARVARAPAAATATVGGLTSSAKGSAAVINGINGNSIHRRF